MREIGGEIVETVAIEGPLQYDELLTYLATKRGPGPSLSRDGAKDEVGWLLERESLVMDEDGVVDIPREECEDDEHHVTLEEYRKLEKRVDALGRKLNRMKNEQGGGEGDVAEWADNYDQQVLSMLQPGVEYTPAQLSGFYKKTGIKNKEKRKNRAKLLVKFCDGLTDEPYGDKYLYDPE